MKNEQILNELRGLMNTMENLTFDMIDYMRKESLEDAEYYDDKRWELIKKMEKIKEIIEQVTWR